jgi:hypothetical protein
MSFPMSLSLRVRRAPSTLLVVALAAFAPRVAHAQPPAVTAAPPTPAAVEEAHRRFQRGLKFTTDGDFRSALVEFEEAYRVAPNWRVYYNVGQTYESLQDFAGAMKAFRTYLDQGGKDVPKARRALLEDELKQLEGHVARLAIESAEPDVVLVAQGDRRIELGTTPLREAALLNSGEWEVTAKKDGFEPHVEHVTLAGGDRKTLVLTLKPVALPSPVVVVEVPKPVAPPAPPPQRSMTPVWMGVGVTGALAIGAGVTGALYLGAKSDYNTKLSTFGVTPGAVSQASSHAQTLALASDLQTGGAIAAAVVTAVLYFTRRPSHLRARLCAGLVRAYDERMLRLASVARCIPLLLLATACGLPSDGEVTTDASGGTSDAPAAVDGGRDAAHPKPDATKDGSGPKPDAGKDAAHDGTALDAPAPDAAHDASTDAATDAPEDAHPDTRDAPADVAHDAATTCIGGGGSDNGSPSNCCSGKAPGGTCACVENGKSDEGNAMACCSGMADGTGDCACIPNGTGDNDSPSSCCTGAVDNGGACVCVPTGSNDNGSAANCCTGLEQGNKCSCTASGMAGTTTTCCTGFAMGPNCACVPSGTADNGSETNCCSGSANAGVCACVANGSIGAAANCCSGFAVGPSCACVPTGLADVGNAASCCSGLADGMSKCTCLPVGSVGTAAACCSGQVTVGLLCACIASGQPNNGNPMNCCTQSSGGTPPAPNCP